MKNKKMLVIDDQYDARLILTKWLTKSGYDTVLAEDGEDALWKVLDHKPDLILTDVLMPKMNGIEFVKRLRKVQDGDKIPVIVLSKRSLMVNCFDDGDIEGFFAKPFDMHALTEKIAAVFNKMETLQDLERMKERVKKESDAAPKQSPRVKTYLCLKCGKKVPYEDDYYPNCGFSNSPV